jgi:hypothetical protein
MSLTYKNVFPLAVALIGGFFLAASKPDVAIAQSGYVPPERPKPQRTQGGGSRGCLNTQPVNLQLLAPKDYTGKTVSAYPTLSWYVSAVPAMPLEIALVEEGVAEPILVKRLPVKNAGIMNFKLPDSSSGLHIGKDYRWTISLVCNPERPSQSIYARAWIQRSDTPKDLDKNLVGLSAYDKTLAYIKAGIWYDAIASISESHVSTLSNSEITLASNLFQDLLQQVGLKEARTIKFL